MAAQEQNTQTCAYTDGSILLYPYPKYLGVAGTQRHFAKMETWIGLLRAQLHV